MVRRAVTPHLFTLLVASLLFLPTITSARPATPIPRIDPANIVRADIEAQNAQDWGAYLALRTDLPGAPESVANYTALWAQPDTGLRGNIIAAHIETSNPSPSTLHKRP